MTERTDWTPWLFLFGGLAVIGILLEEEPKTHRPGLKTRSSKPRLNLTGTLTASRERSEESVKTAIEKESFPIKRSTEFSTSSRRLGKKSLGSPRTSIKTGILTTPVSNDSSFRKYPAIYYSWNKKKQWKYRQSLNH